jgi:hypothetical protein
MGLSPREQHALDSIKDRLAGSDPELAALLGTFTRLTSGEEMPDREPVQLRNRRPPHRGRRHPHQGKLSGHAYRVYHRLGFHRVALLLWLVITVALITTAMAFDRSSQDGCSWVAISAAIQRSCPAHDTGPQAAPPAVR